MNERAVVLTRDTYYQVIHDLWRALPPPVSDRSEDLLRRDNAAMAVVASLLPADPEQAELACKFVALCAHAKDCLRLVNEHAANLPVATKCRAQALSMMRQACTVRSLLLRIQQGSRKSAALGDTSANEPAWSDHGIVDRMTEALRQAPAPSPQAATEGPPDHATIPGTPEPAFSQQDTAPAASARTAAPAEDALPVQTVSVSEIRSENYAPETSARPGSVARPMGDTPGGLPGPQAASRPPHHPNKQLEAMMKRVVSRFAPPQRKLPASVAYTAPMIRTPHPADMMPRARTA